MKREDEEEGERGKAPVTIIIVSDPGLVIPGE
jgi:hypothetical protein